MFLQQRHNFFKPPQFIGSVAGAANSPLMGTIQKYPIDRTWPLEEIRLHVDFTVNTGGITLAATPQSNDAFDNIMQIVSKVNLTVNDGKQPRSVIDMTGIGLIEYQLRQGFNLDRGTTFLAASSQGATLAAGNYTMVLRIPMVDDDISEPLRSRLYLPIHTYPQDPVLSVSFANAATMYSAGNINFIAVTVQLVRRQATAASEAVLRKNPGTNPNGYIDWDLIETPFNVAPGVGSEQRFALPIPGSYLNLLFRHYLGGANISRKEIDNGATGSAFGTENRWRLESGLVVVREWNWKHLRAEAEFSDALISLVPSSGTITAGIPAGGVFPAGQGFAYANSAYMNFLTDGVTENIADELGSVLDCNTPANTGLKMEVIGTPTNVATNGSTLAVTGRRLFGDLRRWQIFR